MILRIDPAGHLDMIPRVRGEWSVVESVIFRTGHGSVMLIHQPRTPNRQASDSGVNCAGHFGFPASTKSNVVEEFKHGTKSQVLEANVASEGAQARGFVDRR
uniref:hypothetical protein n=1 Tax=Arthrobacter sp. H14 TaxID=1312959 RepID=UPI00056A9637|nr:hypothetical protein [Arthrobacter sp. H14]